MKAWIMWVFRFSMVHGSSDELMGAVGGVYSSSEEVRKMLEKVAGFDTRILIPVIFDSDRLVVSPVSEYGDIEEGERRYVEEVIRGLPYLAWETMAYVFPAGNSEWILSLAEGFFTRNLGRFRDCIEAYKKRRGRRGLRFTDVIMKVWQEGCDMLGEFGESVSKVAGEKIRSLDDVDKDLKEKEGERMVLNKIMEYGESLGTRKKREEILRAQEVVCEIFKYLWGRPGERDVMETVVYLIGLKYEMMGVRKDAYPLIHYINHSVLIKVYDDYGARAGGEVIKRVLIEDNDASEEYAARIVKEVESKEREEGRGESREMCSLSVDELMESLGLEDSVSDSKRGSGKRKERKRGKRKKRKELERQKEGFAEVPSCGDTDCSGDLLEDVEKGTDSLGERRRIWYKIHKRVLRWRKSPEKIQEELNKGSEEKWRGRSIEDIATQKVVHDIAEVVDLLRSCDADDFFVESESYTKGSVKREGKIALAILETPKERRVGVVEVGISRDGRGQKVIYHLMFKARGMKDMEKVMRGYLVGGDIEKVDDDSLSMSGFEYPPGVRCSIIREKRLFRIEWRNPKNVMEMMKSLTIFPKQVVG
ncbi:DUF1609 domain-containing protein [Encephalitozoon hellem]|uniref:DUF1609 domain-containing protein n=1 Tax=Encephalitozoon hellem TaxID=27973 RepID=A0A9Q9C881_ENCHE|nr:DUF1609 domain-containing protein [Encephalitozoon hellem]UTX43265.1 DUF1609 domain-containing protein [Encephalitozoon hellem]